MCGGIFCNIYSLEDGHLLKQNKATLLQIVDITTIGQAKNGFLPILAGTFKTLKSHIGSVPAPANGYRAIFTHYFAFSIT
tara:strand:- start:22782 stop:23021 length:240 start_codon:yes stop_codon:yes gene_type:complete